MRLDVVETGDVLINEELFFALSISGLVYLDIHSSHSLGYAVSFHP